MDTNLLPHFFNSSLPQKLNITIPTLLRKQTILFLSQYFNEYRYRIIYL